MLWALSVSARPSFRLSQTLRISFFPLCSSAGRASRRHWQLDVPRLNSSASFPSWFSRDWCARRWVNVLVLFSPVPSRIGIILKVPFPIQVHNKPRPQFAVMRNTRKYEKTMLGSAGKCPELEGTSGLRGSRLQKRWEGSRHAPGSVYTSVRIPLLRIGVLLSRLG